MEANELKFQMRQEVLKGNLPPFLYEAKVFNYREDKRKMKKMLPLNKYNTRLVETYMYYRPISKLISPITTND